MKVKEVCCICNKENFVVMNKKKFQLISQNLALFDKKYNEELEKGNFYVPVICNECCKKEGFE